MVGSCDAASNASLCLWDEIALALSLAHRTPPHPPSLCALARLLPSQILLVVPRPTPDGDAVAVELGARAGPDGVVSFPSHLAGNHEAREAALVHAARALWAASLTAAITAPALSPLTSATGHRYRVASAAVLPLADAGAAAALPPAAVEREYVAVRVALSFAAL